eukprot:COSAG06_NODE_3960_length_4717_cov_11.330446_4_plen_884_part_00
MTTKPSVAEAVPPTPVAPRRAGAMALAIQTVTGQRLAVDDAIRTDTLARLRARISLTHGIAAGTQRLMIDQVTLLEEGPQTLAERGIGPESALFLSLQAADHLNTERQRAVAAAETAVAEADTAVQGQVGALPQPRSRLLLYRDDGSPKHRRWFHLSCDAEGVASVSWGKNEDGSNHMLWASCGSTPPKSCEVHGVRAEDGPAGVEHGFRILPRTGQPLLVAAADGETREKWVGALDAVQSQREAVGALERAREALRWAPAEAAGREEEAREAERFVEYEREVYALLVEAERQIQMGAKEFGAAVVTLRRALALDGANKEAWAALDRVAFVLGGRIYAAGDDGRLDLAGQELGREGVAELARWLATDAGAAVESIDLSGCKLTGATKTKWYGGEYVLEKIDSDMDGFIALCAVLGKVRTVRLADCGLGASSVAELSKIFSDATAAVKEVVLDSNPLFGKTHPNKSHEQGGREGEDTAAHANFDALASSAVETLSLRHTAMGPKASAKLAATLRSTQVTSLTISTNPIHDDDMVELLEGLKDVGLVSLAISNTGVGVSTASKLAELLSGATKFSAAVASLRCGNNPGMVGKLDWHGDLETSDAHADVFKQLTDSLKTSQVTEADFSSCGIGPVALGHLSDWVREATAAVESIDLSGCGLTGATKDRYGRWQKIDSNMDGFIAVCAVLGKVRTVRLVDCGLGASSVAELSKIFSDATAAIKSLTIDSTGVPAQYRFGKLVDGTGPKTYTLTAAEDKIELSKKDLGSADVALLTAWLQRPEVSAAVTKLVLSECPLTGGTWDGAFDTDLAGVTTLFDALKTSSVTELDLRKCRLGPRSTDKLSEYLREATAALTELDVRWNKRALDEAALAELRAAAPRTCKILTD